MTSPGTEAQQAEVGEARPLLYVVIPAYNEQECLPEVVAEWCAALERLGCRHRVLLINDGSTDGTWATIDGLCAQSTVLEGLDKANSGHGQSCVRGYREALARGADWVFQIDSDGQCDPQYFPALWALRDSHPAVMGRRVTRDDGLARRLISQVCRLAVRLASGVDVADANVPYRLIRADVLGQVVEGLPGDFGLANILVAVILQQALGAQLRYVEIGFRDRRGGTASVKWSGFARQGRRLFRELRANRALIEDRCQAVRGQLSARVS